MNLEMPQTLVKSLREEKRREEKRRELFCAIIPFKMF